MPENIFRDIERINIYLKLEVVFALDRKIAVYKFNATVRLHKTATF